MIKTIIMISIMIYRIVIVGVVMEMAAITRTTLIKIIIKLMIMVMASTTMIRGMMIMVITAIILMM